MGTGKLLRNEMPLSSRIPYVIWRILRLSRSVKVRIYSGDRLVIRSAPAKDLEVAYEVYAMRVYAPPRALEPDSIRLVVDVGANVGYTTVFLARRFPAARVIAFEPHPIHVQQAKANIAANHLEDRVTLHMSAAGVRSGKTYLTDEGGASRITSFDESKERLPIEVADFFAMLEGRQIDLLKLDCEGGEYDLLMDPRFETLAVRTMVMEWHLTREHPSADVEIKRRLAKLGWEVEPVAEYRNEGFVNGLLGNGVLWAFRG